MDLKTYSIAELEHLTGLSKRTIHFYIQEKVIPPSEGAGGAARYSDEHLLRLTLVKQMQQSHLKLSGIREALSGLSLDEMRELSTAVKKRQSSTWDREAIKKLLVDESEGDIRYSLKRVEPDAKKGISPKETDIPVKNVVKEELHSYGTGEAGETDKSRKKFSLLSILKRTPKVKERSWERFEITDGVEMNVRSDVAHENEEDLKDIVDKLRQIMKEDSFGR